jgi:hypothetical protein
MNAPTNAEQDWIEAIPQGATDLTTIEITDTVAAIDRFKRIITGTSGKTELLKSAHSFRGSTKLMSVTWLLLR